MPRPLSATDDEILEAAHRVFQRRGTEGFSVAEVAREVGLSRTAITARFHSAEQLKRIIVEQRLKQFEQHFASVDLERGAAGLLTVARMIGRLLGRRQDLASFLNRYNANMGDPVLAELEVRRGILLREVVRQAMPDTALDPEDAADAFVAHLSGSILYWQNLEGVEAEPFLQRRTENWLRLAGIVTTPLYQ